MTVYTENINILWGSLIVEELIRNGIDYFLISPGSRSTPLTVAVARNPAARYSIVYDERSAAFHALGYARGGGKPAVLICTSGTAIANYTPAVVEASMDYIPMIILAADRPPEKIQTGANQTIRQSKFFGEYVRWSFDLPCPSEEMTPLLVLSTVDQAIHLSTTQPNGPVHLNCQFREPLAPTPKAISSDYLKILDRWQESNSPYTTYRQIEKSPGEQDINAFVELLNRTRKGLLVLGRLHSEVERGAALKFSRKLGWPVFADILSGNRLGNKNEELISYFDLMLLAPQMVERIRPQTIVHLGEQPASKRFLQYIDAIKPSHYVMINDHSYRSDPMHRITWRIDCGLEQFFSRVTPRLELKTDGEWLKIFQSVNKQIHQIIDKKLKAGSPLSEPDIARLVSRHIPSGHALFLANSLPIRDMDMFGDTTGHSVPLAANRGVSGIDGTIATASGAARGWNRALTLIMGDLAFLHDLNSLSLLNDLSLPLVIIVINNGGGGIFSFLPVAQHDSFFETFFGTPHHYTFENAAAMFKVDYFSPASRDEFMKIYQTAAAGNKPVVIEIHTDRRENYSLHIDLFQDIISAMAKIINIDEAD
jgi:2-succinyl-5-enolpyruvyl-6-hydroxy-3-cyclohexene-1-carboxylate synthase